jgi:FKBP-type peptidyl-prolyl cis-trans isomerase
MKYEGTKLADFEPRKDRVAELEVTDIEVGTGEEVKPGATITAHYTGALVKNGIIFQSSHDFGKPISFGLAQVIKGWTEGVPGMKVGGMRRLVIPSEMAYGSVRAAKNIPPNSDLVFDIELVAVPHNGN